MQEEQKLKQPQAASWASPDIVRSVSEGMELAEGLRRLCAGAEFVSLVSICDKARLAREKGRVILGWDGCRALW